MTVELDQLIALAPDILKFMIPGYICLHILAKLACIKVNAAEQWVLSVAISFCTIALVEAITSMLEHVLGTWEIVLWCIAADCLLGVLGALIWNSSWLKRLMAQKLGATLFDGALHNAIDWKEASAVCVYLKSETTFYAGYVTMVDDTDHGWITISAPIQYDSDHNVVVSHEGDYKTIMAIPLSDVKRIQIVN